MKNIKVQARIIFFFSIIFIIAFYISSNHYIVLQFNNFSKASLFMIENCKNSLFIAFENQTIWNYIFNFYFLNTVKA